MNENFQDAQVIGPKRSHPVENLGMPLATPLGEGRVGQALVLDRSGEWGWGVEGLTWTSPFGRVDVGFHVHGRAGEPFPTALRVLLSGGSLDWDEPKGEPFARGDKRLAWSAGADLDLSTALLLPGKPVRIHLSDYDAMGTGPLGSLFQAPVEDVGLEAEIASEIARAVEAWSSADEGYAARIYSALVRCEAEEREVEVEAARSAYLAAARRREVAASAARTAAGMIRAGGEVTVLDETGRADRHAEIRGFAAEALDATCVDEVLAWAPESIHVEVMSDAHAWMGVYLADGRRIAVNFGIEGCKLKVAAEIDDDGLD